MNIKKRKDFLDKILLYSTLIVIAVVMVLPFVWSLSTSLKPDEEIFRFPPNWIPEHWDFANYKEAWEAANFARYFMNSSIVAGGGTLLTLIICSLAAYAFSKLEFTGRDLFFWLTLATLMIPPISTFIPVFILVKRIPFAGGNNVLGQGGTGWFDSYWGLVFPMVAVPFGTFLLRQFFKSIPKDLSDAARIDGCSELGIFAKIILPLSKPALATLTIFTFQALWNAFLWPLIVTFSDNMRVVQLGLTVFQQQYTTNWGPLMSGTILALIPTTIVFFTAQKHFVRGIALTGFK